MKKGTLFAFGLIGGFVLLVLVVGSLIPVLGHRCDASKAVTAALLSNLQVALADYQRDHGVYPPDRGDGDMDKCSETLYFYLAGQDVDAPDSEQGRKLRSIRSNAKCYFDFKKEYLADHDRDGYWEIVDAWGQPWIYVVAGGARQPFHHTQAYDLYSVGPDGKTGSKWKASRKMLALPADDPASFYRQASDDPEDGSAPSGVLHAQDDIANF